ncbi:MAG: zinc ribbon domain-containing protein [Candidatus Nitrosotenuis sp.]|nr:MAG: zinc ribbon domain-containing protein [Candidatus Nitrosotenuis sp.]
MKVFNGKSAAEDYMSAHTLAFSTPELTLMRYSFWLADIIPDPKNKDDTIPRIMAYVEEKDFAPVNIIDDDKFEATGAVRNTSMYGNINKVSDSDTKFCSECGSKISLSAKFCTECGATQD